VVLHEGVFEYEVTAGTALAVTLLRCVGLISAPALATRPWDAGPDTPTPDAQMFGRTTCSLGLWARAPVDDAAALMRGWERFALPIVEARASGGGTMPSRGTLLGLAVPDALLSNVRRTETGIEVRVWNPSADQTATATLVGETRSVGPARVETMSLPDARERVRHSIV
jgi:hypothetical protein